MKYSIFPIFCLLLLLISSSCKNLCNEKPVCVKVTTHIDHNNLEICYSIKNNTGKNIYITPSSFLFSVNKIYEGSREDALIEFYMAESCYSEDNGILSNLRVLSKTEEKRTGRCGVEYKGVLYQNKQFKDSVIKELHKYVAPSMKNYVKNNMKYLFEDGQEYGNKDSLDNIIYSWLDMNLDCYFIPKDSTIIVSNQTYDLRKINFDKLFIQFEYPNNNRELFSLSFYQNNYDGYMRFKNHIDSTKINFPKTLLGYELYTDSIKSEIVEIKNLSNYKYE